MHTFPPILALCAPLFLAACGDSDGPRAGESDAVWTSLDSADHWRVYKQESVPEGWVIDADGIHLVGTGVGDLITREQYASFELELEWKISPGGNSGIMYHVSEDQDATYMSGPEMQVLDNATLGDATDLLHASGADYGLYAPTEDDSKPAGEWNAVRILVDGPHVEYWMNGVQQCTYELWSEEWKARVAGSKFAQWPGFGMNETGHIAIQDHGNEVWYRKLRIRSL